MPRISINDFGNGGERPGLPHQRSPPLAGRATPNATKANNWHLLPILGSPKSLSQLKTIPSDSIGKILATARKAFTITCKLSSKAFRCCISKPFRLKSISHQHGLVFEFIKFGVARTKLAQKESFRHGSFVPDVGNASSVL